MRPPVRHPFLSSLIVVLLLCAATGAWAHPASAIRLEFDQPGRLLKIVVVHDTKNPSEHFIKTVSVRLNGREILKQEFASQEDGTVQTVAYKIIDAKSGDSIEVTAVCNVFGKKKESMRL
jgi:hypothetical protein